MKLLETVIFDMKNTLDDTSLVVQWLSLCTSTAGGAGSIPHALQHICPPPKNKLDKINGRLDIVEERLVQVLVIEAIQNETKKIFLMKRAAVIYGTTSSNLINIGMLESPKERAGGEYGGNT